MRSLLFFLGVAYLQAVSAQTPTSSFGDFPDEQIKLKECSFDVNADAVILFDKATANYDERGRLLIDRHIRLKVLKESGVKRGDIRIVYYSDENFEDVNSVKAMVFNSGDQKAITHVDKKSMFRKPLSSLHSMVTFAVPNVRVGSIIDYKYTSVKKNYGGLREWVFQHDIPILLSSFDLFLYPTVEFAYTVHKSPTYGIWIKSNPEKGNALFEMENIPGLRDEPYGLAERDYLQRVDFQFAGYVDNTGFKHKSSTSWKELAKELVGEVAFGKQLKKDLDAPQVDLFVKEAKTPNVLIQSIFNLVRNRMAWDDVNAKFSEGVKDAWEKKRGNSGDINLILVNLLRRADLDANPMLVSERDNGKVDTTYPYYSQFNKVVACVRAGGSMYVLDATDRETPYDMIPFDLLNTVGFEVDRDGYSLNSLSSDKKKDMTMVSVSADVSSSGAMTTSAIIDYSDYASVRHRGKYRSDKQRYHEGLGSSFSFKADSVNIGGLEADTLHFKISAYGKVPLEKSGDYTLLNYNLFTGLYKNPFTSENRFSTIDFGCPTINRYSARYTIPANWKPESLPKDIAMRSADGGMSISRQMEYNDGVITIVIRMDFLQTVFDASDYLDLKAFYQQAIEMINEPILLVAK